MKPAILESDAKPVCVQDWIKGFKVYARSGGMIIDENVEQKSMLCTYLISNLDKRLNHVLEDNIKYENSLDENSQVLMEHFLETHPLHRRRMDFLELKHKKGDSIEELAAEVVDHVNEADLPRMSTEDWYLFGILEKCNDKTFKEKILDEGSNMTYKRMMSKLKVYNESRAIMKKDHINVNKVDGQMPNRGCWKCGKEDHRRDSCKERVFCSNCQSQNHATKICRSGGNRPGTPHTRGSRGNTRGSTRGNTRGRGNTRSRQQIRANMAKLQETLDLQQAELDEIESETPKADE